MQREPMHRPERLTAVEGGEGGQGMLLLGSDT